MGKPLVRFWEGQESPTVWTRYCGTAAKAGGKRRRRTSSCSGGRLLPTRRQVYQATDTKLNRQVALKILPEAFTSDPDLPVTGVRPFQSGRHGSLASASRRMRRRADSGGRCT